MLSVETAKYFSLNDTAEAIWRRMERPITLKALEPVHCRGVRRRAGRGGERGHAFVSRLVEERIVSVQT